MNLSEQLQACGAQSPLVPLSLGLVSVLERIAGALLADAAEVPDAAPPAAGATEPAPLAADDPVLLAALGLLALRSSLGRWLALARAAEAPGDGAAHSTAPRAARHRAAPAPGSLLR